MEIYEKYEELSSSLQDELMKALHQGPVEDAGSVRLDTMNYVEKLHRSLDHHGSNLIQFSTAFAECLNPGPGCKHSEQEHDHLLWVFDHQAELRSIIETA